MLNLLQACTYNYLMGGKLSNNNKESCISCHHQAETGPNVKSMYIFLSIEVRISIARKDDYYY